MPLPLSARGPVDAPNGALTVRERYRATGLSLSFLSIYTPAEADNLRATFIPADEITLQFSAGP